MKNKYLIVICIFLFSAILSAWKSTKETRFIKSLITTSKIEEKSVGKNFEEIKIGSQIWALKNLDVVTFNNGDLIPMAKTNEDWKKAAQNKKPAWCYYDGEFDNGTKYGKLYNWYAVNDPRKIAPKGWHIPNNGDWAKLTEYLGGEINASTKMKSTTSWTVTEVKETESVSKDNSKKTIKTTEPTIGNGTNESNFTALPGGSRDTEGLFHGIGYYGSWWSATEGTITNGWDRILSCTDSHVYANTTNKACGFSLRCIKN